MLVCNSASLAYNLRSNKHNAWTPNQENNVCFIEKYTKCSSVLHTTALGILLCVTDVRIIFSFSFFEQFQAGNFKSVFCTEPSLKKKKEIDVLWCWRVI